MIRLQKFIKASARSKSISKKVPLALKQYNKVVVSRKGLIGN